MPANALVGRWLAVSALRSAVDAALAGAGQVVLLAGEAGMGKTALAGDAAAYAKDRGAVAAWGTCWEGHGAPGFWPWIQVVRAL
ncbi:MAG TPA: ATP-binding protein, partial [Streptosporangiaceae bacterium]|nr:ATP-binding protein [Streptosporangiaceae bacterium]